MKTNACSSAAGRIRTALLLPTLVLTAIAYVAAPVPAAQAQGSSYNSGKPASGEKYEMAAKQERIQIDLTRKRRQRTEGGDYDDKTDKIQFVVKLTNRETNKEVKGLKAVVVLSAQNVVERKKFMVLLREEFPVELGTGKASVFEHETKEATTMYDDEYMAKGGERYDGWLVAILNSEDQIVAYKTSNEGFNQHIAKIKGLEKQSWFDIKLEGTEPPLAGNRHYRAIP